MGVIMKFISTALLSMAFAVPMHAETWNGINSDGIRQAMVGGSDHTQILVLCDIGVNAPITSVNFTINGTVPLPNSQVRMEFDNEDAIYVSTDVEGGIGSLTATDAEQFDRVVHLLKSKTSVKVRLFDGSERKFNLRGSTQAIGVCPSDYSRYQLAAN